MKLIQRHCGGWIAVSDREPIRIGVSAHTGALAIALFESTYAKWIELLRLWYTENCDGDGI